MNFDFFGRVSRYAAIGAILLGSASCVAIDESIGENLIPTNQKWDVFNPDAMDLAEITLEMADSLSGYSTTRFTFGSVQDEIGTTIKSTSFTLVPFLDTIDLGTEYKIRQFHFAALRDTLSMVYDNQVKMLQNIYVSELKEPLDSTVLYSGAFMKPGIRKRFLGLDENQTVPAPADRITVGTPVYDGGDSLSFDFSIEFAESFVERLKTADFDSLDLYLKDLPGIYITTDPPTGYGGRINMFNVALTTDSQGYLTSNFAELKLTIKYEDRDEPVDTSFYFFYGPAEIMELDDADFPTQFAFNASSHSTAEDFIENWKADPVKEKLYIEGGSGLKPVIRATEIKKLVENEIRAAGISEDMFREVVINKATLILPYDVQGDYEVLEKYPTVLSPTVRLRSTKGNYISYAGLTDSSISSENQGNINRSLGVYTPDVSHHVQEILKLDWDDENFAKEAEKFDIWFLIMHEEAVIEESTTQTDYYNNLQYQSYYNAMMYDPYGYGYGSYGGYGYGSYGYGGYGSSYGYGSNYYNYYLMSMYANSYGSSSSETETTVELDTDRYYHAVLNGPGAAGAKPQLKITFSAPKTAEL